MYMHHRRRKPQITTWHTNGPIEIPNRNVIAEDMDELNFGHLGTAHDSCKGSNLNTWSHFLSAETYKFQSIHTQTSKSVVPINDSNHIIRADLAILTQNRAKITCTAAKSHQNWANMSHSVIPMGIHLTHTRQVIASIHHPSYNSSSSELPYTDLAIFYHLTK